MMLKYLRRTRLLTRRARRPDLVLTGASRDTLPDYEFSGADRNCH
jgi:hypothetical protein